jgi:hypothetical protein
VSLAGTNWMRIDQRSWGEGVCRREEWVGGEAKKEKSPKTAA